MLDRRAGTLHLGVGPGEDRGAALLGEGAHRPGGPLGELRAGIERADPVLAHEIEREAFDRRPVELEAGGDDQKVVVEARAAAGRHTPRFRVDLGRLLFDQASAGRQPIARPPIDHVGGRLEPDADEREAGLVEMLAARVHEGDRGPLEPAHEPVGDRGAGRTGAHHDDARGAPHGREGGRRPRSRGEHEPASEEGAQGAARELRTLPDVGHRTSLVGSARRHTTVELVTSHIQEIGRIALDAPPPRSAAQPRSRKIR